jgi:hypothetical protein
MLELPEKADCGSWVELAARREVKALSRETADLALPSGSDFGFEHLGRRGWQCETFPQVCDEDKGGRPFPTESLNAPKDCPQRPANLGP